MITSNKNKCKYKLGDLVFWNGHFSGKDIGNVTEVSHRLGTVTMYWMSKAPPICRIAIDNPKLSKEPWH